jgi:hypothetical protein
MTIFSWLPVSSCHDPDAVPDKNTTDVEASIAFILLGEEYSSRDPSETSNFVFKKPVMGPRTQYSDAIAFPVKSFKQPGGKYNTKIIP